MIYRYERKFVFTNKITNEVETMIKLLMGNFSEIYSPRFINNIYFDKFDIQTITTMLMVIEIELKPGLDGMVIFLEIKN